MYSFYTSSSFCSPILLIHKRWIGSTLIPSLDVSVIDAPLYLIKKSDIVMSPDQSNIVEETTDSEDDNNKDLKIILFKSLKIT